MLEHERRPLGGERFPSALEEPAPEARPPGRGARGRGRQARGAGPLVVSALRRALVESRVAVGLGLVAAGIVWAIFRGLHFYGFSPVNLAYDFDQPPVLLVLVSGWLLYRSWRR
jgi:hypothetical protein